MKRIIFSIDASSLQEKIDQNVEKMSSKAIIKKLVFPTKSGCKFKSGCKLMFLKGRNLSLKS